MATPYNYNYVKPIQQQLVGRFGLKPMSYAVDGRVGLISASRQFLTAPIFDLIVTYGGDDKDLVACRVGDAWLLIKVTPKGLKVLDFNRTATKFDVKITAAKSPAFAIPVEVSPHHKPIAPFSDFENIIPINIGPAPLKDGVYVDISRKEYINMIKHASLGRIGGPLTIEMLYALYLLLFEDSLDLAIGDFYNLETDKFEVGVLKALTVIPPSDVLKEVEVLFTKILKAAIESGAIPTETDPADYRLSSANHKIQSVSRLQSLKAFRPFGVRMEVPQQTAAWRLIDQFTRDYDHNIAAFYDAYHLVETGEKGNNYEIIKINKWYNHLADKYRQQILKSLQRYIDEHSAVDQMLKLRTKKEKENRVNMRHAANPRALLTDI